MSKPKPPDATHPPKRETASPKASPKTTTKRINQSKPSERPPIEYRFNEPDTPQTIQYEEGTNKIKLATFSKLIERVTSPDLNGKQFYILLSFFSSKYLFSHTHTIKFKSFSLCHIQLFSL